MCDTRAIAAAFMPIWCMNMILKQDTFRVQIMLANLLKPEILKWEHQSFFRCGTQRGSGACQWDSNLHTQGSCVRQLEMGGKYAMYSPCFEMMGVCFEHPGFARA